MTRVERDEPGEKLLDMCAEKFRTHCETIPSDSGRGEAARIFLEIQVLEAQKEHLIRRSQEKPDVIEYRADLQEVTTELGILKAHRVICEASTDGHDGFTLGWETVEEQYGIYIDSLGPYANSNPIGVAQRAKREFRASRYPQRSVQVRRYMEGFERRNPGKS